MKIGLLSDVHANLPALDAVLDDMPPVDRIVHAGDIVGYGPDPQATVERFREEWGTTIQGNHDRGAGEGADLEAFREHFSGLAFRSLQWTREHLTAEARAFLANLPAERWFADGAVRVVHGAPDAPDRYTPHRAFSADLLGAADMLVLGHTHVQSAASFAEGVIVNPGSVGQPRDGDPRAAYAVLDTDTREVDLRRVRYPVRQVQKRIRASALPDILAEWLETGKS